MTVVVLQKAYNPASSNQRTTFRMAKNVERNPRRVIELLRTHGAGVWGTSEGLNSSISSFQAYPGNFVQTHHREPGWHVDASFRKDTPDGALTGNVHYRGSGDIPDCYGSTVWSCRLTLTLYPNQGESVPLADCTLKRTFLGLGPIPLMPAIREMIGRPAPQEIYRKYCEAQAAKNAAKSQAEKERREQEAAIRKRYT